MIGADGSAKGDVVNPAWSDFSELGKYLFGT